MVEHVHLAQCGSETGIAFLTGMMGHFVFDAALILLGAVGFTKLRNRHTHHCNKS